MIGPTANNRRKVSPFRLAHQFYRQEDTLSQYAVK